MFCLPLQNKTTTQLLKKDMKKLFLAAWAVAGIACTALAQSWGAYERPKLVVGIIVDQMRWDYLDYYYQKFGEGGFKRLMGEGYSCDNHFINYVPSVTSAGHASNYTGSVPAINGIAGNNFEIDGKTVYCTDDPTVNAVGSKSKDGKMSPRNLLVSTMGDQLKLATDFRSKVIGISLKDRASILPAGHAADAAYWYDKDNGIFISSTYYMQKLPRWVDDFNKEHKQTTDIRTSPAGNTIVADMAIAAINGEDMGSHATTDFLAVSFSSTDYIGHKYGTRASITEETYVKLDADLARIFALLDSKLGKGNYLAFLSADHAASHNADYQTSHKLSAGVIDAKQITDGANEYLKQKLNMATSLVKEWREYRIYLDNNAIEKANLKKEDVENELCKYLTRNEKIQYAVPYEKAASTTIPAAIRERIINGYNPKRSGDIQVVPVAGVYADEAKPEGGTTHGTWCPFDTHIPLIFYGWNVPHGHTDKETHVTDLAATVCAMLHIQMPNGCIGTPIKMK